jgi:hypothetical protein
MCVKFAQQKAVTEANMFVNWIDDVLLLKASPLITTLAETETTQSQCDYVKIFLEQSQ